MHVGTYVFLRGTYLTVEEEMVVQVHDKINIGGTIVNFVWDKAKKSWKQEKNNPITAAVETYSLTAGSASLLSSPDKHSLDFVRSILRFCIPLKIFELPKPFV